MIGHLSTNVSGSSLSFRQLVDKLVSDDRVESTVVNTARPAHLTTSWYVNIKSGLKVTFQVIKLINKYDVVTFSSSRPAMMLYGPIIYLITRIFKRPLIVRLFGGEFEAEYEGLNYFKKWLMNHTVFSSELCLLQTKHLVSYFTDKGIRCVRWFPTSRKIVEQDYKIDEKGEKTCKNFIFLGRVIREKGIDVILESIPRLNPGLTVDIYGSLDGEYTDEELNAGGGGIVRYRGVLSHQAVNSILVNYDALILPTYYQGEGYPGVVVEAYNCGLPVIVTNWRAIPEIVDETTGILIPVKSAEALAGAMNWLNSDRGLYNRLRKGAYNKRLMFSDDFWTDRFINWCEKLDAGLIPEK